MPNEQLHQVLEAALFAADKPLSVEQLQELLALTPSLAQLNKGAIRTALKQLQQHYDTRGVQLIEVASGFRFQTRAEFGSVLAGLWQEKPPKYSSALLETLAMIAYRQPLTRADIEAVRGVSVSSQIMKTLQERGWVKIVGHREVPGRPQLYATTAEFLDYFGLKDLSELPALPASDSNTEPTPAEIATNQRVH